MSNGKAPVDKLAGDVIADDVAKSAGRPGKTQPTTTAPQGRVSQVPRWWLAAAAVVAVLILAAASLFAVRTIQGPGGTGGGSQSNPAATKVALAGAVNCDCPHVEAGLLTGPYIRQCQQREQQLKQLVAQGTFHVEVGTDHKIVSGDLEGSIVESSRAIELAPGRATMSYAFGTLGLYLMGRSEEALTLGRKAADIARSGSVNGSSTS